MIRATIPCLIPLIALATSLMAGEPPLSPPPAGAPDFSAQLAEDELRRKAAIAEFTQRMKDANYPALFDQAAKEFNVPPDVLKGVAFAETRWEHLTWPPGETASPETGMPRPYGIMSLWDNNYFGHSLIEAAKLIGQDPEVLKNDPMQNMRGGAALLRKIYDQTPRADGSSEQEIEGWRYAIRAYSGIPEPDLNARHALNVFTYMNKGYHRYGIEWDAHPVNLEPMRLETRQIVLAEQQKREAKQAAISNAETAPLVISNSATSSLPLKVTPAPAKNEPAPTPIAASETSPLPASKNRWWAVVIGVILAIVIFAIYAKRSKVPPADK